MTWQGMILNRKIQADVPPKNDRKEKKRVKLGGGG